MAFDESDLRPRRSLLYMPASNARAIEKALGLDCDGVILDLEDSVAPEAKLRRGRRSDSSNAMRVL